ncbi:hypothetical protein I6N95_23035 [Vagococcus sp. BWB3-3]|uniref:Uncharacterized protein n=1 Tax=Vagococcus allomyrinae TaxID=2794353 RepID=A0A940PH88_9ENTE|nr:hypothetical protein [Vagococcus allomyrinae]MBP1043908.1 hypothetical protein [Vagococcus allomyrinae]
MENIQELQAELEQVKLELESEKFKNSYSEELLSKTISENEEWEQKLSNKEKEISQLKSAQQAPVDTSKADRLASEVAQKEVAISQKEQIIAEKERALTAKEREVSEKNGKIAELEQIVNSMPVGDSVANSELADELALAKMKINSLETELSQLSVSSSQEDLVQSKKKINELMLANQQLREESAKSQQGIGEVMLVAKQQAARMIADAEESITVNIETARQELFDIGNKANTISDEIKASQDSVNGLYKELLERLSKMSEIDFKI